MKFLYLCADFVFRYAIAKELDTDDQIKFLNKEHEDDKKAM